MKALLFTLTLIPAFLFSQEEVEWLNKGVEAQNNQQFEIALSHYNKCLKINNSYVLAYRNRSIIYYQLKEYQRCISDCEKGIELDSEQYIFYKQIADCQNEMKQYAVAIQNYQKALDRTQIPIQKAGIYYQRSWCHDKLMQTKEKVIDLKEAVKLDPKNITYLYACGRAKFDLGGEEYKSAVDHFNTILDINPEHKEALIERATYYMTFQNFERALSDLRKAKTIGADVDHLINAAEFELESR